MKKKVAFFAEILIRNFDGASRTMFNIIDRIPKDDFEFVFFCGVPPDEKFDHKVVDMLTLKIPFNSTYKMAIPYLHILKIWKALKELDPDVIHIASPSPLGNIALCYAKTHNIPVVGIYHTHFISYIDYYFEKMPIIASTVKHQVVKGQRNFYNRVNHLFVPTTQMVKELGDYGFETKDMVLWQRGLDHKVFHPGMKDKDRLQEYTGNTKPNIIFASRLVWEKNLQTLANVYKLAKAKGLEYNFIIAGDGVAKEGLKELMPEAMFLGSVPQTELAWLYASCDVFIFPSITETYGNVVVEAMASGCPCVIAKGGGSQSHVQHGENGYLADPDVAEEYLTYAKQIIGSPTLAAELIAEGRVYTRELDWDKLCAKYFEKVTDITNSQYPMLKSA